MNLNKTIYDDSVPARIWKLPQDKDMLPFGLFDKLIVDKIQLVSGKPNYDQLADWELSYLKRSGMLASIDRYIKENSHERKN